jgi:hypothetical protein
MRLENLRCAMGQKIFLTQIACFDSDPGNARK